MEVCPGRGGQPRLKNVQKRPKKADEKQLDKWLNKNNNNKLTCQTALLRIAVKNWHLIKKRTYCLHASQLNNLKDLICNVINYNLLRLRESDRNLFLTLIFFKNLPSFHSLLIKLSLNKHTRTILPLPKTDEFYHN